MKSAALSWIDPSIAVSIVTGGLLLAACATCRPIARTALLVVETAWLYVWNTRG